jgi:DNA-binding beta-propeller fold protein YncE
VTRIDLRSARATATIKVTDGVVRLSAGKTAVWATGEGSTVNRIDPRTDRVVGAAVNVGDGPLGVDATSDLVWVAVENTGQVTGLDPAFRSPRGPFTVGGHPGEIAVGGGKVWVTDARGRSVDVVDLTTGAVRTLPLETTPTKVTWSGSAAWVSCVDPNELIRLS